ncbi:MAG TPA: hypothetical protein PL045_11680, partial [Chitinophagaceae bacterium]|nr:hypothetical protein [Chitinophagaceae bacterium]
NFTKKVRGEFIILKCLTHHAIFMDAANKNFYAVKALSDPFTLFFERFPVHVITTLIPFKNKIIYDGFFQAPGIYYGRNIAGELHEDYKTAKCNKAIITRLDI